MNNPVETIVPAPAISSPAMTFEEMPLHDRIKSALRRLNFASPTPIQQLVFAANSPELRPDIIANAETGSGKTAAFSIPAIERLLANPNERALILAPTRELAMQIRDFVKELTFFCKHLTPVALVGGTDIRKQLGALRGKPRVLVATPGRLNDHLRRGSLSLGECRFVVLDEGDRMLDMGFAPQLRDILKYLPKERQTWLFTATTSPEVKTLAREFLSHPKEVRVGTSRPAQAIKQSVLKVTVESKQEAILDELNNRQGSIIVFMRTKSRTDKMAGVLKSYGFSVDFIHGGRSQGQRNTAIKRFRSGQSRILCATDVAARGIDVPEVAHVINFDLPMQPEDYVHRIGRTARNGASGEAISFVVPEDIRSWNALARKYDIKHCLIDEPAAPRRREFGPSRQSARPGRPQGRPARFEKRNRRSERGGRPY